jgi:hypothetical protein
VRRRKKSCAASSGAGARDVTNMNDKEDDLCLARDLLAGQWGEMGETIYLKGEDALRARAALARLLLAGPLNPTLAGMLAAVFEPEPNTLSFGRAVARSGGDTGFATAAGWQTVDFKRRSKKRSVPCLRNETVWSWMQQRLDDGMATSIKDAKRQAMKEFSLTPGVVNQIWLAWLRSQRIQAEFKKLPFYLDKP